ncbi:hypothetical protein ACFL6G_05655, partial [candidate division KSB1 bacterium]
FTFYKNSVYGTDDRGVYFVKFGPPDQIVKNYENLNPNDITRIIGRPEVAISDQGFVERERGYSGVRGDFEMIRYEIWIYRNMYPGQKQSIIHIFAEAPGVLGRSFRHYESLEDLVPHYRSNNTPFAWLYFKLSGIDEWFYDRFVYADLGYASTSIQNIDHNDPPKFDAPLEKSILDDIITPVRVVSGLTRILDEKNKPAINILVISSPYNMISEYSMMHTLKILDGKYNEIDRLTQIPGKLMENISVFRLDHADSTRTFIAAAEAFEEPVDSISTRHIGRSILKEKAPLDPDPGKLELSDIISGIDFPENIEAGNFPYKIIPTDKIYRGDALKVYLEIYHLFLDAEGKGRYEITYTIEKKRREGWLYDVPRYRRKGDTVSRTSAYEASSVTVRETVGFDISSLKEGKYTFSVTVKDLISMQEKSRAGEFEILQLEEKEDK